MTTKKINQILTPNRYVTWEETYSKLTLLILQGFKVAIGFALLDNTLNITFALMFDKFYQFFYTSQEIECKGGPWSFVQLTWRITSFLSVATRFALF
jgi:hypothetical protein